MTFTEFVKQKQNQNTVVEKKEDIKIPLKVIKEQKKEIKKKVDISKEIVNETVKILEGMPKDIEPKKYDPHVNISKKFNNTVAAAAMIL